MNEEAFYRQLVRRYLHNTASDEELELFFRLMKEGRLDRYLAEGMDAEPGAVQSSPQARVRKISLMRAAAAAIILLLLGGAGYWLMGRKAPATVAEKTITEPVNDIVPGSNKAILTLGSGDKVVLDSAMNGLLTKQGSTRIVKLADGQVSYKTGTTAAQVYYNTLTTPRGGQYRITLPDGTEVWLNAASSIRYPTVFTGNERRVEITGEAYFEVAKVSSTEFRGGREGAMPFIVSINGKAEVEVLGTHFNINAYSDEENIKTTLLEGSVRLTRNAEQVTLKPGEQGIVAANYKLQTTNAIDVDEVIAWKNGYFSFTDASIQTIMKQAARWYDVEVVYEGNISDEYFSGQLPRSKNISSLLSYLELTKTITCSIQDKKIIIRPRH